MKKCLIVLIIFFNTFSYEKKQLNIGLCVTATNKYIRFIKPFIKSAKQYFLNEHKITFYIFTDRELTNKENIKIIYLKHQPWPHSTMQRFEAYHNSKELLNDMDYIFACDVDMIFARNVTDEILSERVGVIHPYFWDNNEKGKTQYESNINSTAFINYFEGQRYFAGGFYGGTKDEFLKLVQTTSENIKKDLEKNFVAVWHDESHLNKYFFLNPPTLILNPSYCYPEDWKKTCIINYFPFKKILVALEKKHFEIRN